MDTPHIVREYLAAKFLGLEYELFGVMFLDARHRLIKFDEMFRGTVAYTAVYPREIAKEALRLNASAVILAHNHPSGSPEPSAADKRMTEAIKEVLVL
jgi:DNA repair protein RadC